MLKNISIIALVILGLADAASAQTRIFSRAYRWEAGIIVGQSNYHGDLAPEIVLGENNNAFGIVGRYNVTTAIAIKSCLIFGKISGTDANFKANAERNLHFRSNIIEFTSQAEFHFQPFGLQPLTKDFTPYLFTGLSVFHFNPQAEYNDEWVNLRPLGTEGQNLDGGKRYSNVSLAIPLGMGVKYNLSRNFVVGFEVGFRKAFTDYLDDVSTLYPDLEQLDARAADLSDRSVGVDGLPQSKPGTMRGDDHLNDWFIIGGLTLTYRFTPIICP